MLDSVVKVAEKITELLNYRAKRRTQRFDKLIEPLFLALKKVHQDYLSVFETAKRQLASDCSLNEIADSLEVRRLAEETERRTLLQQAETFLTSESHADCQSFFNAMVEYFRKTPFSGGSTPSNAFLHTLKGAARKQSIIQSNTLSERDSREELSKEIERALSMLRQNWERVSSEYAKALASSVE